ncbi:ATPase [Zea mays]|uniref:ATPase n=1 Tax=Zea mays TaxID=4577 RepID=A0A1D6JAN0_MAIZE|nr:ATPase [Zea mays]
MRSVVRSLRQLRRFIQHYAEGNSQATRLFGLQNALIMCGSTPRSLSMLRRNGEISRFASPGMELMRSMFSNVAAGSIKDIGRGGPMVEYERRIASGDLVDGDSFQVDTIQQLQGLYEELIENGEDCQLDRYKSSEKSGRSRWLWSRLITQPSSFAPVKGLYLYGGVGTGKTMLMDLFYEQLPSNWRKKRIHFHDFMLNVHSRLQMHKGVSDPLDVVAAEISDEAIILCLDEFMVTDVADAMILNRLFRQLFSKGIVCGFYFLPFSYATKIPKWLTTGPFLAIY